MKLLFDILPVLVFFLAYKLTNIYIATSIAMVVSLLQTGLYRAKHGRFEILHLLSLFMVLVFGGATLVFHNEAFIKWKPTAVNWSLMLLFWGSSRFQKKPFVQRILSQTLLLPEAIWWQLNTLWVIYFFLVGASNLWVAEKFSTDVWVNFKLFGLLGLTVLFILGQSIYLSRYFDSTKQGPSSDDSSG